jgi:hypothetical protein
VQADFNNPAPMAAWPPVAPRGRANPRYGPRGKRAGLGDVETDCSDCLHLAPAKQIDIAEILRCARALGMVNRWSFAVS